MSLGAAPGFISTGLCSSQMIRDSLPDEWEFVVGSGERFRKEEIMKQIRWTELVVRVALLLFGLTVAHLGVTLFLESDLGSDPFNVLVQGLFRALPWPEWMTHGRVHLLVSLMIVAVLLFAARSYVRIGTLLCMALGGPIIDLWTVPLAPLFPDTLAFGFRLLALVLGCVILAFGMTIVICSEAGTGPNDLVAVVLSDRLKKPFGPVRVIVDLCFALTGWLFGGVVGIGTLVCAGLVGPCAQVFMPFSGKLCGGVLGKVLRNPR